MREILTNEKLLRRIEWANVFFLLILTGGAWLFFSVRVAGGVLLGGIVSTVSFQVLKWQLRRAFRNPEKIQGKGKILASYYLRFLAVAFVIFTIIYYGWVHPIALLVGLSVVVISILVIGFQEILLTLLKGGR